MKKNESECIPISPSGVDDWARHVHELGYAILPGVLPENEVSKLIGELAPALAAQEFAPSIRSRAGSVYAARNVIELFPECRRIWKRVPLLELLTAVLGDTYGLVRALYFDKPPDRTWSLPWHQDRTIAVRSHHPSQLFTKPTIKAGIRHVEAPIEVLEQMLTLRFHLDTVTDENGPLCAKPGSHRRGGTADSSAEEIVRVHAQAGDVLAMRPLLVHSSGCSQPGTHRHRRILHLEFSGQPDLPDKFEWHRFVN